MSRSKGNVRAFRKVDPELAAEPSILPSALFVARVIEIDEAKRTATLSLGEATIEAAIDETVDLAVMRTAKTRRERVIATREGNQHVVLGALRTAATPGVDEGEEFLIKAKRIAVVAAHELSAVSGASSLVLRARGYIETVAEDITSRASTVHKIVGRIIRLN